MANEYKNLKKTLIFVFLITISIKSYADNENIVEIKNPIFTIKGIDGAPYEIKAEKGFQNDGRLDLFVIEAKLKTNNNIWVYLNADRGTFFQEAGYIELEDNIIVYTEDDEKIYSDLASVNTNNKIITLLNNVKYQNSNILITANKSVINHEFSNIFYSGNVKSVIIKKTK